MKARSDYEAVGESIIWNISKKRFAVDKTIHAMNQCGPEAPVKLAFFFIHCKLIFVTTVKNTKRNLKFQAFSGLGVFWTVFLFLFGSFICTLSKWFLSDPAARSYMLCLQPFIFPCVFHSAARALGVTWCSQCVWSTQTQEHLPTSSLVRWQLREESPLLTFLTVIHGGFQ